MKSLLITIPIVCVNGFNNFTKLNLALRFWVWVCDFFVVWYWIYFEEFKTKNYMIILLSWMDVWGTCTVGHVHFNRRWCNAIFQQFLVSKAKIVQYRERVKEYLCKFMWSRASFLKSIIKELVKIMSKAPLYALQNTT